MSLETHRTSITSHFEAVVTTSACTTTSSTAAAPPGPSSQAANAPTSQVQPDATAGGAAPSQPASVAEVVCIDRPAIADEVANAGGAAPHEDGIEMLEECGDLIRDNQF